MIPALLKDFIDDADLSLQSYRDLFQYFVEGFLRHRSKLGALAQYRGRPSFNGALCDRLEGFARFMPAVGAWLHGGRPRELALTGGHTIELVELMASGLRAGTDPASPEFWGPIDHRDQRIVEAADIALALWLARDTVWAELPGTSRQRIVQWLNGVNGKRTADNNWHLFVVLVNVALAGLGEAHDAAEMSTRHEHFKAFYRGDGWFSDGPGAKFDYYNAWGIHYPFNWVRTIDPGWDAAFLGDTSRQFVTGYKHFFGPCGFPIMGRSACYRMAAPAPLVQAQALGDGGVTSGEARRALDLTWRWFIRRGAVANGTCTQGYGRVDPRILDNYSGPASPLWSLRSLTAALALPEAAPFWRTGGERLPVELGDFELRIPATGWRIQGIRGQGDVLLHTGSTLPETATALEPYGLRRRLSGLLRGKPNRPDNTAAKYHRGVYGSRSPFCGFG